MRIQIVLFQIVIAGLALTTTACRKSAAFYSERGNALYTGNKFAEASIEYRKALQQEPQSGEIYYRLALAELKQSKPVDAYRLLVQAVQFAPTHLDAKIQLADIAYTAYESDPNRARHLYDQIVSLAGDILARDPQSADGLRLKGQIALIDRHADEAIRLFTQANTLQPMQVRIVGPLVKALMVSNRAAEGEALALRFLDKDKTSSSMYDLLYLYYIGSNRMQEAEQLLKSKSQHNPGAVEPLLQLASHYGATQRASDMAATLDTVVTDSTKFPEGRLRVADFFMMRKQPEEAIKHYQAGISTVSSSNLAAYQKGLARAFVSLGKSGEAEAVFAEILKSNPSDVEAQAGKASLLLAANKKEEALPILKQLVQANPGVLKYRVALARAHSDSGDLRSAGQEFNEALKIEPRNVTVLLSLAELSQRGNNHKDTIRFASDALSIEPANTQAKLLRTIGLFGQTSYPEARAELQKLIREQPQLLEAHLQLGLLNIAEKRYQDADTIFQRFYQPGQGDLRPLNGLLETRIAQRQFDSAIQILEAEQKRSPQSLQINLALASTAVRAGRFDIALKQYEALAAQYPDRAEFKVRIGQVHQSTENWDKAIASFQAAEKLAPGDWTAPAYLGSTLDAAGRKDAAIASYRRSLTIMPNNGSIMNNLAYLLAETGKNLEEAAAIAEDVRRRAQDNPAVLDTVGFVYLKRGQFDSALQVFNRLAQKYPQNPIFQYRLAMVYVEQGQTAKAKEAIQKAIANNPRKPYDSKIQELLKRVG